MSCRHPIILIAALALAVLGCAEQASSAANSSLGSNSSGAPNQSSGAVAPSTGSSQGPGLSTSSLEPGSAGIPASACAVGDFICLCELLYGRFAECYPGEVDPRVCQSPDVLSEYPDDFAEDCAEAGLSLAECWSIATSVIDQCTSNACDEVFECDLDGLFRQRGQQPSPDPIPDGFGGE